MATQTSTGQLDWPRATVESLGDAVVTTDSHGAVTFLNPAATRLLGRSAEEVRGLPLPQILQLLDEQTHRPVELPQPLNGTSPGTRRAVLSADGGVDERVLDVDVAPVQGEAGGTVLVLRDATERVRAERALR